MDNEPELAKDAVLQESEPMPKDTPKVSGYDWSQGVNYEEILKSYKHCGFQATNFGKAVDEINKMIESRAVPLDDEHQDAYEDDDFIKRKNNCTIFFGYTSNIVSSGLRETIRFLAQHKLIDCIVTTAGKFMFSGLFRLLKTFTFRWRRGGFNQMHGANVRGIFRAARQGAA